MNIDQKDFQFLKEFIIRDLGWFLMDEFGMSPDRALNAVYESKTYEALCNPSSELYYQSSEFVYQFLKKEITTGKFDYSFL